MRNYKLYIKTDGKFTWNEPSLIKINSSSMRAVSTTIGPISAQYPAADWMPCCPINSDGKYTDQNRKTTEVTDQLTKTTTDVRFTAQHWLAAKLGLTVN